MKKNLLLCGLLLTFLPARAQQQNCIDFDGVDDYIEVPAVTAGLATVPGFSMSCWVFPTNSAPAFPNFDGIMGFRNDVNADFFMLQLSATNFEVRFRNSAGSFFTINSNTCQLNTWQHITLVYTGSQLRFYHNGVLSQSIPASGTITNTTLPLTIGRINFQTTPFLLAGRVDEAAVWNRALSDSEVFCTATQKIDPLMPGLLHYYSMDQGIAGGNNVAVPNVIDAATGLNGNFNGLALTGATSNFVAGTTRMTLAQLSFCRGVPLPFGGQIFTQAGTYRVKVRTFTEACDSTILLTLVEDTIEVGVSQNRDTLRAVNTTATYQWLNCNAAFSAIAGATSATFVAAANGRYAVRITENGCSDTSACVQVSTVGLKQLGKSIDVKLFPNPGNEYLQLQWPADLQKVDVKVYSTLGQLMYTSLAHETTLQINTQQWPAGIYFVQLQSDLGYTSLPWQKQ